MLTHRGRVRDHNEDTVAYVGPGRGDDGSGELLALVADGMGGHAAGEVASRMAADAVLRAYRAGRAAPPHLLSACFEAANGAIWQRALHDPECAGMGTTCTVLAIRSGAAFLGHIGDSRAYLWREHRLRQLSEDHSLVAQLVRDGRLTREEAQASPERHVILRALGVAPRCEPAVWREGLPVCPGDVFVLCSDGLSDLVDDQVIADTAGRLAPFAACEALVGMALAAGGTDNVSVGVFAVADEHRWPLPRTTRPLPTASARC
jgi:PPM family protein phosphatase